jgi:serine/threonine-protein kinase CTR1
MNSDIILPEAPREVLPLMTASNLTADKKKEFQLLEGNQYLRSTVSDLSLAVDDLIIPWNELVLKEKIGAGTLAQRRLLNLSSFIHFPKQRNRSLF